MTGDNRPNLLARRQRLDTDRRIREALREVEPVELRERLRSAIAELYSQTLYAVELAERAVEVSGQGKDTP